MTQSTPSSDDSNQNIAPVALGTPTSSKQLQDVLSFLEDVEARFAASIIMDADLIGRSGTTLRTRRAFLQLSNETRHLSGLMEMRSLLFLQWATQELSLLLVHSLTQRRF